MLQMKASLATEHSDEFHWGIDHTGAFWMYVCRNRRLTRKRTDTQNRGVCTKNDELCGSRNKHVRSQIQLKSLERLSAHNRVETEEKGTTAIKMQAARKDMRRIVVGHNSRAQCCSDGDP